MKRHKEPFILFIVIMLAPAFAVLGQTPPPNDNFDNRTVLTGSSVTFGGSLTNATLENDETSGPNAWMANGATGSVWWTWTAPVSSTVVVTMTGAPLDNFRYALYTGTDLTSLTMVTYDAGLMRPAGRYSRFDAAAGTIYQIQVIGSDSRPFSAQIVATNPPVFIFHPKDCTVSPYGSAFFSALATGPAPPGGYPPRSSTSYQWFFNGTPISGQIFPSLLVHGVTTNQAGTYSVIASNSGGVTQGGSALLTVIDTNPVPHLTVAPPTNSNSLNFTLTGEPGRLYKVQSSTNLRDWTNSLLLQLTNSAMPVSISRVYPNHLARAFLDLPAEVCIAQLKQMQWALSAAAIENHEPGAASSELQDLKPYVPLTSAGSLSPCPEGGTYVVATFTNVPFCNRPGHVLPVLP